MTMFANESGRIATTNAQDENVLTGAAAAFSMSAAITVLFNTVLAWVKDLYAPLNDFMTMLTGHHWRTHGIFDLIVFVGVGFYLSRRQFAMDGTRLALTVGACSVVAGAGLALYFLVH
jgi:hypothetical protein